MRLQNVLFPNAGRCTIEELYFRKALNHPTKESFCIHFKKKSEIAWFDTYFNAFSIEKWLKYTTLKSVSLKLKLKGFFVVTLINKVKINNDIIEKELKEYYYGSEEIGELDMEFNSLEQKGIYFFKLQSLKQNSYFYGGEYFTNIDKHLPDINIGIVMCTFKREAFVENNLSVLSESILENQDSELFNHLKVFISDNGKSLNIEKLSTKDIFIFPNKNVGGAGGFTRGLIEILNSNQRYNITHALFMDDDIIIEPESLVKTYNFLKLLKPEYKEAAIGGSMLRLDYQFIQTEASAVWNAGKLMSLKSGLDLRSIDSVIYNETEEYNEFNAWWYCCMPMAKINENNLPLPIFIRGDDVEYGIRNIKNLILLNGICVWHEPFENKYTSFLEYYIVRNLLIDNSIHYPNYTKKDFLVFLFKRITREMAYFRYKNVELIFKATEDFFKGLDWFKNQDGEALHKEIMSLGYKSLDLDDLDIPFSYPQYALCMLENENKIARFFRLLTLNGYILPGKYVKIVPIATSRPINYFRAKRVLNYDVTARKGFTTKISRKTVVLMYFKFLKIGLQIIFKFSSVKNEYRARYGEITCFEFWNKYLEISGK